MFLKITSAILGVLVLSSVALIFSRVFNPQSSNPSPNGIVCTQDVKICPDGSAVARTPPNCEFASCPGQNQSAAIEVITQNLEIPWGLTFLPDKSILVTERPGRVRMIDKEGNLLPSPVITIQEVKHIGEDGLLGIALHPNFSTNRYVYLYYTYSANGVNYNRVERFQYEVIKLAVACPGDDPNCGRPTPRLGRDKVIVDKIPSSSNHNGGRIKFGPDGFLYITTGDSQNPSLAQDKNSLAGKILRVTDEGKPAPGNPFDFAQDKPFGNLVYSYGHRNPQGITWDSNGVLWETEHGSSTMDEFNKIEAGKNYGWPEIRGDQKKAGMEQPFSHSGDDTWAPAGTAYYKYSTNKYSIFFGGLRGQALYEMEFNQGNNLLRTHFKGQFGRIRDVVLSPDNFLYITTSNRDGRGAVLENMDKIIKINPRKL